MKRYSTIAFLAIVLAMIWGYRLMLWEHVPFYFNDPHEDLSYGWYVPIFSLYVLWRERQELLASVGEPNWVGLLTAIPFLFLGFIGARGGQVRFEILGFIGLLMSATLLCFGWRTVKQALFPALFLLFCLPLHSFLDAITIHLRLLAVTIAHGVLNGAGLDVIRQGTMLTSPMGDFAIDVASPCSGLRSLFAMMALTAGYAYFTQPSWVRRGLLFALSIPIAICGNVVRILTIVLVAATCSADFATGFYHDYSGYVVFLTAIALMVGTGTLITKGAEQCAAK